MTEGLGLVDGADVGVVTGRPSVRTRSTTQSMLYGPEEFGQGHIIGTGHVHRHGEGMGHHAHTHGLEENEEGSEQPLDEVDCENARGHGHEDTDPSANRPAHTAVGRKRQVVGILVRFSRQHRRHYSTLTANKHPAGVAAGYYDAFVCHRPYAVDRVRA
jgi:hypothetical protein